MQLVHMAMCIAVCAAHAACTYPTAAQAAHDELRSDGGAASDVRVVIVDARPHFEGRELLRRLIKHGVRCTYVLQNALSYVMKVRVARGGGRAAAYG